MLKNINWKKRLTNKTTLTAIAASAVGGVYGVCNALGIELPKSEGAIMAVIASAITLLQLLGIVIDPTTPGISDGEKTETK